MATVKKYFMNINWKVRAKNKMFWLSLIPAALVLLKRILAVFGIDFDYSTIASQLTDIVEAVFVLIAIFGVVVDPTTKGISDSELALSYEEPKES